MNKSSIRLWIFQVLILLPLALHAQLSTPEVFANHMVLQRETEIPVWGSSAPNANIEVSLNGNSVKVKTGNDGKWRVNLSPLEAGGPYTLRIESSSSLADTLHFEDVMIGDVWFASGQSNMEFQVQQADNLEIAMAKASNKYIRFLKVPHEISLKPKDDLLSTTWQRSDSVSVKDLSAVAFYFAEKLQKDLNIPIGIIQSTWGGTPVEAWTSREILLSSAITEQKINENDTITFQDFKQDSLNLQRFWDIVYNPKNGLDSIASKTDFIDTNWKAVEVPGNISQWEKNPYEGIIWLRKEVKIQKKNVNNLEIHLGHPEMNYSLYFNGKEIAKTIWNANPNHTYKIPDSLIQNGNNIIAIRIAALWGGGGLLPPEEEIYLLQGNKRLKLTGTWKFKKGMEPEIPTIWNYHQYPTYLYNAMINPVIPYAIKGFIWYQGENNEDNAYDYRELFPMLIRDWRARWQQETFPFLFVQLPDYREMQKEPAPESKWAVLRESQFLTLQWPNTGMVGTLDLGEAEDIHPKNKIDVGLRLAKLAKKQVYGKEDVSAYGPVMENYRIERNKIYVRFKNTGDGLKLKNGQKLEGFVLAGEDKIFHWADAKIQNNYEVVISSDRVPNPVAIRYAWADNPKHNLVNSEDLPTLPFRTDEWKVVTEEQQQ